MQRIVNRTPVVRDVKERGRDIDGIIKQWFTYVKPSYKKYVEPQRAISGVLMLLPFLMAISILTPDDRPHHSPWH